MKRALDAVTVAYYLLLIGIILWSLSEEPVTPKLWYQVTRACQAVARFAGTMGLAAEQQYFESVERTRL